jgi:hypothetical protein
MEYGKARSHGLFFESFSHFFSTYNWVMLGIIYFICTLWLFNIAMENGPCIDDFPS